MSVFISHKSEDKQTALNIVDYLRQSGIKCYIDVLDPGLNTTDDISNTIMQRVEQCSHLMAIVSNFTQQSWWVPFEIGVTSKIDKRITSYEIRGASKPPDFLLKWPVLRTTSDLTKFISHYRDDRLIPMNESLSRTASAHSADRFHRNLKSALSGY